MSVDSGPTQHAWETAGHLTTIVPTPARLAAELAALVGWPPTNIIPGALNPWEVAIRACTVTADDRHLHLSGIMGWGEVLANIDLIKLTITSAFALSSESTRLYGNHLGSRPETAPPNRR